MKSIVNEKTIDKTIYLFLFCLLFDFLNAKWFLHRFFLTKLTRIQELSCLENQDYYM